MGLTSLYDWVKDEPITAGVIGSVIATFIVAVISLLIRRLWRWCKRKAPTHDGFPFEQLEPKGFGKRLEHDLLLTCYDNPFIPKEEEFIYESDKPKADRRRIYLGEAETGKTRAAYEWVRRILNDTTNAEILIPTGAAFPNLIAKECIPILKETVVLFYDNLHEPMLGMEKDHQEGEGRMLSLEDRFRRLIKMFEQYCTHFYVVCTTRQEPAKEGYSGIWKTFNILKLKDAPKEKEIEMIRKFAEYYDVELADGMAQRMA